MRFLDLEQLEDVHAVKRLRLAFTAGQSGQVDLEGDAQALVAELIRLAKFGVRVRQVAECQPKARAATVVRQADLSIRSRA
jgi:hypothetical protein